MHPDSNLARSSRCLVTGATGSLGPSLVQGLIDKGYAVRALVRHTPPTGLLPDQVEILTGDLSDPVSLAEAVQGIDIVFHLAAKLHINNPGPELRQEYYRINVEGTRYLAEAARDAGVQRFIYFSSICVYGPSHPDVIFSETTPVKPDTLYGETKQEGEKYVLSITGGPHHQPFGVVLRLAAVYGPRMKGNYPRLVRAIHKNRFVPIGDGANRRTLVHEKDVVAAALLAAEHPAAPGKIYNVTDGTIHTLKEILQAISHALGKPLPRFAFPVPPVRFGLACFEELCKLTGIRPPIGRATIDKFTEDIAVSGQQIQRELGFQPQVALQGGWDMTIQEWTGQP